MTKKEQKAKLKDIRNCVKWLAIAIEENAPQDEINQLAMQAAASCYQLEEMN